MRPVTPEDVLAFASLTDLQTSPDGMLIAFVRGDAFKEFGGVTKSQIWIASTHGRTTQASTSRQRADWSARWSPDAPCGPTGVWGSRQ